MSSRIVVGVDGSETSTNALDWAVRQAKRTASRLDIVMAWHYPVAGYSVMGASMALPPHEELAAGASAQLNKHLAQYETDLAGVECDRIVVEGSPSLVLCDAAQDADLLVVGSRGFGGFKGLILGSVSAYCANHSPCAVAIIPEEFDPEAPPLHTVVVGIDGSPNSDDAVKWADKWAPEDTTIRLVNAWSSPVVYDGSGYDFDLDRMKADCENLVATAAESVKGHPTETECIYGDARSVLEAEGENAAMLVVGARGHGGLGRMLVGSVASRVVHNLATPTVLVHAG